MENRIAPHEDIVSHVFQKLLKTLSTYRDTIPSLLQLEKSIIDILPPSSHLATEEEVNQFFDNFPWVLRKYADKSFIGQEIFENIALDFFHSMMPNKIPLHQGEYYITSIGILNYN